MPLQKHHLPKKLLLIFIRNPKLGQCKTRLAATVGDRAALAIYTFLLQHTAAITQNLKVTKIVYYSDEVMQNDMWNDTVYQKRAQQGEDLGQRMKHAFAAGFGQGFNQIVVIGSDLYDLEERSIQEAFDQLHTSDYVIGPATDGGYYLLGMKELNAALFVNKNWGKPSVFRDTMQNLKHEKVSVLRPKNDIDYYEDIKDIEVFAPYLEHLKTVDTTQKNPIAKKK